MFRNVSKPVEKVIESIVSTVSVWVCKRKEFVGIPLEDFNRSWGAFLKGGWWPKVSHRVHWLCPSGFLKLNFDGSYLQSIHKGGFGGV